MTWTVPSLGPPRVDFSWISSLADPVLERMQQQQDAANIMKTLDTNWQQPQVSAPGGLAALQPVPGTGAAQTPQTPQAPSGASMGFATRSQRENPSAAEFYQTYYPIVAKATEGTGVDPMIAMGQIAQETGYGRSIRGNNLFNITGPGTVRGDNNAAGQRISQSFRNYETPDQAVADYVKLMTTAPRYRGVLAGSTDERLQALGRSGYAEDPSYGQHVGERVRELQRVAGMAPPAPSQIVQGASVNVPAFRSGLTPAQDAQNLASLQGMQQTGMQPAATGSVADRSIVPGSKPNPVAMDQNQAAGNGDLADLQSIVMNPRSPPNMREWAVGELAKRGIKVPGVQVAQAGGVSDAQQGGDVQERQYVPQQGAQPQPPQANPQADLSPAGGQPVQATAQPNYYVPPGGNAQPQAAPPPQRISPPVQQAQQQLAMPGAQVGPAGFSPQQKQILSALLSSPGTRQLGMALIQRQLDPMHFGFQVVGDQLYRTNPRTGQVELVPGVTKEPSPLVVAPGSTAINPRTGEPIYTAPDKTNNEVKFENGRFVLIDKNKGEARDITPPGFEGGLFNGNSIDGQAINEMVRTKRITKDEALDLATGKFQTDPRDGSIRFYSGSELVGRSPAGQQTGGQPVPSPGQAAPAQGQPSDTGGGVPNGRQITPGKPVPPEKVTADEARNRQLYMRTKQDLPIILDNFDALSSLGDKAASQIPGVGNYFVSEKYQRAATAIMDLTQTYLYSPSGAAAPAEEVRKNAEAVTPKPGDKPGQLKDKRVRIQMMVDSIKERGWPTGQGQSQGGQQPPPNAPAPSGAIEKWGRDPATGKIMRLQ